MALASLILVIVLWRLVQQNKLRHLSFRKRGQPDWQKYLETLSPPERSSQKPPNPPTKEPMKPGW
jgi:hypothetical protein